MLEENEMRAHMEQCAQCARHDALVRRSLMLVRSLPTIELSPDFQARLAARLLATSPSDGVTSRRMIPSFGAFVTIAATVVFAAVMASLAGRRDDSVIRMHPVVASAPEIEPSPLATPALVATVPTGMSIWPAIMAASQASMHFVAAEMASER
jgi:hypothetical protein